MYCLLVVRSSAVRTGALLVGYLQTVVAELTYLISAGAWSEVLVGEVELFNAKGASSAECQQDDQTMHAGITYQHSSSSSMTESCNRLMMVDRNGSQVSSSPTRPDATCFLFPSTGAKFVYLYMFEVTTFEGESERNEELLIIVQSEAG